MSDPAWATRVLVDGTEGTLYVQTAADADAPVAADMLAFVTDFGLEITGERTTKGPWLNLKKKKRNSAGVEYAANATIDWSKAADAPRAMLINAAIDQTRLKITFVSYEDGDTYVLDQSFVDASLAVAAAEGKTGEFSFEADLLDYTAATA